VSDFCCLGVAAVGVAGWGAVGTKPLVGLLLGDGRTSEDGVLTGVAEATVPGVAGRCSGEGVEYD